jgi:hypothetical protein
VAAAAGRGHGHPGEQFRDHRLAPVPTSS